MPGLLGTFPQPIGYRPSQGMGGAVNQIQIGVAASTTIYYGDILAISNGVVSQAIALPGSNNTGSLSGGSLPVFGIALANFTSNAASVDTSDPSGSRVVLPVAIFDGNLELLLQGWNATAASSALSNYTLGSNYQIGRWRGANSSTWLYYVSQTTTNGEFLYSEEYGLNNSAAVMASTQTYPFLWGKINSGDRAWGA